MSLENIQDRKRDTCRAVSDNMDLVRSIQERWDRGDFTSIDWADEDIELEFADGPDAGRWKGVAGLAEGWRYSRTPGRVFVRKQSSFGRLTANACSY